MRFHEKVADTLFLEQNVIAGVIRAFGKPNAPRTPTEVALVIVGRDADLRARRLAMGHERQIPMRRRAGDYFEHSLILKLAERLENVASIPIVVHLAAAGEL